MIKTQLETGSAVAEYVSKMIVNAINENQDPVLILASGGTPTEAFEMAGRRKILPIRLKNTTIIKLDEWVGLNVNNQDSCEYYLQENVIKPWGITPENYISFNGSKEPHAEVKRIDELVSQTNNADLCILGLGLNGHIGFIEPGPSLPYDTSCIDLHADSKNHPMVAGKHDVSSGITLGLKELFRAKKIVLMVTGAHKKDILKKLMNGQISTNLPATMLKLHPNVEVVFDSAAA